MSNINTHVRTEDKKFKPANIMAALLRDGRATINVASYITDAEAAGQSLTADDVANRIRAAVWMQKSGAEHVFRGVVDTTADEEYVRLRLEGPPTIDPNHVPRFVNSIAGRAKPPKFSPFAVPVLKGLGFSGIVAR